MLCPCGFLPRHSTARSVTGTARLSLYTSQNTVENESSAPAESGTVLQHAERNRAKSVPAGICVRLCEYAPLKGYDFSVPYLVSEISAVRTPRAHTEKLSASAPAALNHASDIGTAFLPKGTVYTRLSPSGGANVHGMIRTENTLRGKRGLLFGTVNRVEHTA